MIELIERTLVNGGDLEQVRLTLLNQANIDRMNRNADIEHDFRIAKLIQECLLMEPKGSSGYAVSKGIMNRLKDKYRDKESERVKRKLSHYETKPQRKEECTNDRIDEEERESDDTSGTK